MAGRITAGITGYYDARAVDNAARLHPNDFAQEMAWRDEMDPQYTRLLLEYSYGGLMTRGVLNERTHAPAGGDCAMCGDG